MILLKQVSEKEENLWGKTSQIRWICSTSGFTRSLCSYSKSLSKETVVGSAIAQAAGKQQQLNKALMESRCSF